jgi:exonuclease III
MTKLNQLLNKSGHDSISLFHFNVRSLPKNVSILNDFLYTLDSRPDILAIRETKLNHNNVVNIDLLNYNFFHTDSPTMAGGAGLYINNDLQCIHRPDIKFSMPLVESCWLRLPLAEIQGVSKKTLRKLNRLSCIINVAKQFNFYIGRKNSYLAFQ